MSELQKYQVEIDGPYVHLICPKECKKLDTGDLIYLGTEVDAARAADKATIAELQERLARSQANLAKYGKHLLSCDKAKKSDFYDCTCGLESALAAADGKDGGEA